MRAMTSVSIGVAMFVMAAVIAVAPTLAQNAPTPPPTPAPQPRQATPTTPTQAMPLPATNEEAMRDIEKTLGFVPVWIRAAPDALLVGFWASIKNLQMNPNTALDGKTKELIGLAVAAQIPCEYCVYFHTAAARKNGATEQEIKEALGMAGVTRMASTMLNGSQMDFVTFRKETDRILKGPDASRGQARTPPPPRR